MMLKVAVRIPTKKMMMSMSAVMRVGGHSMILMRIRLGNQKKEGAVLSRYQSQSCFVTLLKVINVIYWGLDTNSFLRAGHDRK